MKNVMHACLGLGLAIIIGVPSWAQGPMKAPSMANLRINGMLMYDDDRSEDVLGIYEYTATDPIGRRRLVPVKNQYIAGDAVVSGGKLYTYHMDASYGFVNSAFYTEIDVTTGEAVKSSNISYDLAVAYSHYATSAAVNPVDGVAYCSGYNYDDAAKTLTPTLKIWDLAGRSKTDVGTMEAGLSVMSFDKDGNLYGITACSSKESADGGYLVSVDKSTGKLTVIGDTGVRPWLDQSGVISPYDGRLYWFSNVPVPGGDNNAAYSVLYAVDLTTAKAERIGDLPNGDEVVAAWIPVETNSDMAPGVVADVRTDFTDASLTGTVMFTLPSLSYSGAAISGPLNWTVALADDILASGTSDAGSDVSAEVTLEKSGKYTFDITSSNKNGTSVIAQTTRYVGYGVPNAPSDVKFVIDGDTNVLTWAHASGTIEGGYMQNEHPAYRIVRQPGDVLLQEAWADNTFTESALDGNLQSTYYEVTPVNGDVAGTSVRSNALVTGSSVGLPYSEDFTESTAFDLYTAIDANGDGSTWYYSVKSAKIRQTTAGTHNDWLVLPPVELAKGFSYEFKFNCYGTSVSNLNILDVAMGTSVDAMNEKLVSDLEVTNTSSRAMKEVVVTLKPQSTATYRLGICIKSEARQGTFTIDDITISEGSSTAVPAAPEVFVTPGEKGALSVNLTFAKPALSAGGDQLEKDVTSFEIERNGKLLGTVEAVAGVNEYTYDDADIAESGSYTYGVRAVNADGAGETAEVSVFVGCDTPLAPENVVAKDNFDGTVTLSWNAPSTVGTNGGYVDTDSLIYAITDYDGTVTDGITGNSAIAQIPTAGSQSEVKYSVGVHYKDMAISKDLTVESNALIAGASYGIPFEETFPMVDEMIASTTSIWTKEIVEGKSSSMTLSMRADADHGGNGGGLHFMVYSADVVARWCSPMIDLSATVDPKASMWVMMPSNNVSFELQIQTEYGDWTTIETLDPVSEWTEVTASLADYRSSHVRLGFLIRSQNNFNYTYVDDIRVDDASSAITSVSDDMEDGEYEIFTIQGVRVTDMSAPGLYIVRTSEGVRKVLVR